MTVYAITQARLGSERLPGKVLKIVCGKPLLDYHLTRLAQVKGLARTIVAAPEDDNNQALHDYLEAHQYDYVKGSESNVLKRYYQTATELQPDDTILRVTADCPLICPQLISTMIQQYESASVDYMRLDTDHVARGFDAELFKVWMLREAYEDAESDYDREHVTPYFYKTARHYTTAVYKPDLPASNQFRLCVDEMSDLALIENVIQAFPESWQHLDYQAIVEFLTQHPELVAINKAVVQRNNS